MSIPVKGMGGSMTSVNSISAYSGGGGNSQTLERPKPTVSGSVTMVAGQEIINTLYPLPGEHNAGIADPWQDEKVQDRSTTFRRQY